MCVYRPSRSVNIFFLVHLKHLTPLHLRGTFKTVILFLLMKKVPQPLEPEDEVCIGVPALLTDFVARDTFKINHQYGAVFPIREIRSGFHHRFLRNHGKKEAPIPPDVNLRCLRVPQVFKERKVSSLEALEKLGGPSVAEITLYEVSWLIRMQRQLRPLQQLNPRTNHFFVPDIDERLCEVTLTWYQTGNSSLVRGWILDAFDINEAQKITPQSRVFYRCQFALDLFDSLD
jgi:hypothetical protein